MASVRFSGMYYLFFLLTKHVFLMSCLTCIYSQGIFIGNVSLIHAYSTCHFQSSITVLLRLCVFLVL